MMDIPDQNVPPLLPTEVMSERDRMFAVDIRSRRVVMDRYNAQYNRPSEPPSVWQGVRARLLPLC